MNDFREKLQQRSLFINELRGFFFKRNVIEVDTQLLREFSVTDPYMSAFEVTDSGGQFCGYLQTSPEYAMKCLISRGSGDIFQLSKMFRANENSPMHSCEFSLLEWYRLGINHFELIEEVCDLIESAIGGRARVLMTYQQAFNRFLGIDPFTIGYNALVNITKELVGEIPQGLLFDNLLTLLFSEKVEKLFDPEKITIVHSFPESQASLAKTHLEGNHTVADRFEVYVHGVELANGFNELTDPDAQLERFKTDNQIRKTLGISAMAIDANFMDGLWSGLPDCSGVALGVDRLYMIAQDANSIKQVQVV